MNASCACLKEKERRQKNSFSKRENQGITIDIEVIKAVIKIYVYMKLSDKTFENLEEMDDFPAKYILPKFTQEDRKGKLKYISYHKKV